jgi:hypothetical protein
LEKVHSFLGAIGLETRDGRAFLERGKALVAHPGTVVSQRDNGASLAVWRDASGVGLAMYRRKEGTIESVFPFFTGARRNRALVAGTVEHRLDRLCDAIVMQVLDPSGHARIELVAVAYDLDANRERVAPGSPIQVGITLLLAEPRIVPVTDTETRLEPIDDEGPLAPPSSRARLRALVTRVEERVNRLTGASFQRAKGKVRGIELDLLAPEPGRLPEAKLAEGALVEGECLVVVSLDPKKHDATMPIARPR